jgi:predicted alpha/beta-fold hydrolase
VARRTILSVSFDATIDRVHGGYSSAAERLTVAQDVEGSIPSSRPKCTRTQVFTDQVFRGAEVPNLPCNRVSVIQDSPQQDSPQSVAVENATPTLPPWGSEFVPHRWLRNSHLQTIVGNFIPRPAFREASTAETVEVDPSDGSRVLCHCNWQPSGIRANCLSVVLVHGLEGSSDSRYMKGLAARAWTAGCNVVRMNMRNCGGTETLTPTLYNSALSGDVGAVVSHFAEAHSLCKVALVGYSMGGNLVLKLAGEWGNRPPLCAVAAVCPAIDLAAGSNALHEPSNRIYERRFLIGLMARFHRKAALYPEIYDPSAIGPIRSLREFDDKIVARYCNFRDADDYYYRAASARVVDRIAVPTLILRALDDPFIRLLPETRAALLANPAVTLIETPHGGHCAYLSSSPGDDIHWAEAMVMRYLLHQAGTNQIGTNLGS